MSCSNVQIEYDGNGVRVDYTFPFTYEDKLEVHVAAWDETKLRFVDVERDTWTFQNATTIRFTEAPEGKFIIYRETDLDEMEVTFYPGSSIRAQDLNDNFEQLRDAIQERWCHVSEEFYEYLDEYIWDVRDAITIPDQINDRWQNVDSKIATAGAIGARTDVYMQDNKPAKPPYEQGGKRWYDTDVINNYIWNDQIGAWIDYARTGPQGPKGADGTYRILIGTEPPKARPDGDPLQSGDIWFNNCTGETWIFYRANKEDEGQWMSFGAGGIVGPQGPVGSYAAIIGPKAPEQRPNGGPLVDGDIWFNTCIGEAFWYYKGQWINFTANGTKGDTGTYQTICSLTAPKHREDETPLQCGDLWFNTCNGELYVYYDGNWLGISDATGPQGPQGDRGPQGGPGSQIWIGDNPPSNTTTYPLWFDTDCPSGLYAWDEDKWVGVSMPGPNGPKGDKGDQGDQGPPGGFCVVGDTPPANPNPGDLWFDTSCPSGLYVWSGDEWVGTSIPGPQGPAGTGGASNTSEVQLMDQTRAGQPAGNLTPEATGLQTQEEANIWFLASINALDDAPINRLQTLTEI